jgi:hypothetical protein
MPRRRALKLTDCIEALAQSPAPSTGGSSIVLAMLGRAALWLRAFSGAAPLRAVD